MRAGSGEPSMHDMLLPTVCTLYTMPVAATGASGCGSRPAPEGRQQAAQGQLHAGSLEYACTYGCSRHPPTHLPRK